MKNNFVLFAYFKGDHIPLGNTGHTVWTFTPNNLSASSLIVLQKAWTEIFLVFKMAF